MNEIKFEVLKCGGHACFVSTQRHGKMFYGQPYGGPMDIENHDLANAILGNDPSALTIESSLMPTQIKFHSDQRICVTGANHEWAINKKRIGRYRSHKIMSGDILQGKPSRNTLRSYVGIKGMTENIANESRLAKGVFTFAKSQNKVKPLRPKEITKPNRLTSFQFHKGPEWNLLTADSKLSLMDYSFTVTHDMDRSGVQIEGKRLELKTEYPTKSVVTFPGVIQLLPSGQLVILLQDGQITGGYARVGFLGLEGLNMLNKLSPKQKGTFYLKGNFLSTRLAPK